MFFLHFHTFKGNDLVDIYVWYKIISSSPTLNIMKKLTGSLPEYDYFNNWKEDTSQIVPYRYYSCLPYYKFKYEHYEFMVKSFIRKSI